VIINTRSSALEPLVIYLLSTNVIDCFCLPVLPDKFFAYYLQEAHEMFRSHSLGIQKLPNRHLEFDKHESDIHPSAYQTISTVAAALSWALVKGAAKP
jgi:hypothetical protein